METFDDFKLKKQLKNAIADLGFVGPTPVQEQSFSIIKAGNDILGIAQTGTGKTLAYCLPILEDLPYSEQLHPRVLILVPTRELVVQVAEELELFAKYLSVRILAIFGGVNINTQRQKLLNGVDIIVATPGRLYDLVLNQSISLKNCKRLVIDEVDVMLDLGFRPQLMSIFELMPDKRQNIMFSATMTDEVEELIDAFFINPAKVSIAVSGTPLDNIQQSSYFVENFYTKINLLRILIDDRQTFRKVLVFVGSKRLTDKLFQELEEDYGTEIGVIHSNKAQNTRLTAIEKFDSGQNRILIATDVIARGLDLDRISHVINFDVPNFPENYMHRIGRTGRAEEEGAAILFHTEREETAKLAIEKLMGISIPISASPEDLKFSAQLLPEERPEEPVEKNPHRNDRRDEKGLSFHEKKLKNQKINLGGSYKKNKGLKYKKPRTKGDKIANRKKR